MIFNLFFCNLLNLAIDYSTDMYAVLFVDVTKQCSGDRVKITMWDGVTIAHHSYLNKKYDRRPLLTYACHKGAQLLADILYNHAKI